MEEHFDLPVEKSQTNATNVGIAYEDTFKNAKRRKKLDMHLNQ